MEGMSPMHHPSESFKIPNGSFQNTNASFVDSFGVPKHFIPSEEPAPSRNHHRHGKNDVTNSQSPRVGGVRLGLPKEPRRSLKKAAKTLASEAETAV